jgi:hypothetical protein
LPAKDKEKIDEIKLSIEDKINNLVLKRVSAKVLITIELNITQGFIGAAFIENNTRTTREKIF